MKSEGREGKKAREGDLEIPRFGGTLVSNTFPVRPVQDPGTGRWYQNVRHQTLGRFGGSPLPRVAACPCPEDV